MDNKDKAENAETEPKTETTENPAATPDENKDAEKTEDAPKAA